MSKRRHRRRVPSTEGHGLGRGHGYTTGPVPAIEFVPEETLGLNVIGMVQPGTRVYRMGDCRIFVSPPTGSFGWHMSISHPRRLPTWDEIAHARYELVPDGVTMAAILPPKDQYINLHNFCMQVCEIPGG
jgi:hypothetical protein